MSDGFGISVHWKNWRSCGLNLFVSSPGSPTMEFKDMLRMRGPFSAIDLSEGHLKIAVLPERYGLSFPSVSVLRLVFPSLVSQSSTLLAQFSLRVIVSFIPWLFTSRSRFSSE